MDYLVMDSIRGGCSNRSFDIMIYHILLNAGSMPSSIIKIRYIDVLYLIGYVAANIMVNYICEQNCLPYPRRICRHLHQLETNEKINGSLDR